MTAPNDIETPDVPPSDAAREPSDPSASERRRSAPRQAGSGGAGPLRRAGGATKEDRPRASGGARPAAPDEEVLPRRGRRSVLVTVLVAAVVLGAFVLLLVGAKAPNSRSRVVGKPAPSATRSFDTLLAASGSGGAETAGRAALADFRGRYVVLNFFASWCVPCEQEHPELVRFQQKHAALGDATVVQVLYNDKPGPARQFFRERGAGGWPVLIDEQGQFALDYGVTGPPETFLIDPQGNVLVAVKGAINEERLEDLLGRAKAGRS